MVNLNDPANHFVGEHNYYRCTIRRFFSNNIIHLLLKVFFWRKSRYGTIGLLIKHITKASRIRSQHIYESIHFVFFSNEKNLTWISTSVSIPPIVTITPLKFSSKWCKKIEQDPGNNHIVIDGNQERIDRRCPTKSFWKSLLNIQNRFLILPLNIRDILNAAAEPLLMNCPSDISRKKSGVPIRK